MKAFLQEHTEFTERLENQAFSATSVASCSKDLLHALYIRPEN